MQDSPQLDVRAQKPPATRATRPRSAEAYLDKLPPELFERVAVHTAGLKSLRLTSQDCASKLLRTYIKRYFTEIDLLIYSTRSIWIATEIAGLSIFGPAVRVLNINISRINNLNRRPDVLELQGILSKLSGLKVLKANDQDPMSDEWRLKDTSSSDSDSDGEGLPDDSYPEQDTLALNVLCAALALSSLRLETLSISPRNWTIDLADWNRSNGIEFLLRTPLASLQRLELPLLLWPAQTPDPLPKFKQLLTSAVSLQELSLRFRFDGEYDAYGEEFDWHIDDVRLAETVLGLTFPGLRMLKLYGAKLKFLQLVAFVERHPNLKRLEFYELAVMYDPWWLEGNLLPSDNEEAILLPLEDRTGLEICFAGIENWEPRSFVV